MRIVCILSGGMDSATLLWRLKAHGHDLYTLSFNYGQRHIRELKKANLLAILARVPWEEINLSNLKPILGGSSQTSEIPVPEGRYDADNMKLTVVPNRNMIMLSVAIARAISLGFEGVAYGAHAGDHTIYPDCRPAFIEAMTKAAQLCDWKVIHLMAPFSVMTKGDIVKEGLTLKVPYEHTLTCYHGAEPACGKCGSCQERLEAFKIAGVEDPIVYVERTLVSA